MKRLLVLLATVIALSLVFGSCGEIENDPSQSGDTESSAVTSDSTEGDGAAESVDTSESIADSEADESVDTSESADESEVDESIDTSDYLTIAKGYVAAFNLIKDLDETCNRLTKIADAQHVLLEKYDKLVEKSGI